MKISVCVVDDHAVVREGLKSLINNLPQCTCDWDFSSGKELVDLIEQNIIPDVILMDISLGNESGWDIIKRIESKKIQNRIIVLTYLPVERYLSEFSNSGIAAFINKDASADEIKATIDDVIKSLESAEKRGVSLPPPRISQRELEFLNLICDEKEYTYEQIAEIMEVHIRTVDSYRKSLFQKLNKKSKSGLVLYALKSGLLDK